MTDFPDRKAMLGKVHLAKKELALDDDTYRAILLRVTGKESSSKCTRPQLVDLLDEFKRLGWKPKTQPKRAGARTLAPSPMASKIRALWLALYHLGEVANPAESALDSYAKRMTGVNSLRWLDLPQASKVIDTLKLWCERVGYTVPADPLTAKQTLLRVQWSKLHDLGIVKINEDAALNGWLQWKVSTNKTSVELLNDTQLDCAAEMLGAWIRKAKSHV